MSDLKSIARAYTDSTHRHPWRWLTLYVAITLLAVAFGRPEVRTDLAELLPEDAPAVMAIQEARERRGGTGESFSIAVQSPDPLANVRFLDALAERVAEWPETLFVELSRDRSFFRDNALLYLPVEDLQTIRRNVQRLVREELAAENPLFVDLSAEGRDEAEPQWRDPRTWVSDLTLRELGLSDSEIGSLFPFLDDETETETDGRDERETDARRGLPEQYEDYYLAPHGRVGTLMASMTVSSTDVRTAHGIFDRGTALIAELDPTSFHPEMQAEVVGAFRDFLEVRKIISDVAKATGISLVLVVGLLIAFFRNARSVVVVTVPLVMGVAWTLLAIRLVFGQLNTLTAFIFSMLIGMGIDFGIHIYQRALHEYHGGASWSQALYLSLTRTGRALLTAMVTTCVALLAMTLASFDGFVEFGIACAMGVSICFLATTLVIPVLVQVTDRVRPLPRRAPEPGRPQGDPAVGPLGYITTFRVISVAVVLLALFGASSVRDARFEYDFRNLSGPGTNSTISYRASLGSSRSSTPAVILGSSQEEMREVHAVLRERLRAEDPRLANFVTIETFLPADQEARMEVIDDIHEILDRRAVRNIGGDTGELVTRLRDMTEVEPFAADDLPEWVRNELTEQDGSFGRLGLLYGQLHWWNVLEVRGFQKSYGTIEIPGGTVPVASSGFILDNVVRYVQADGQRLAIYVFMGLFLVLLLDLRSLFATALCLVILAAGIMLTIAGMTVFNVKLGLYNMVVLPTVLGVGVDGAVHLYHRYLEEGRGRLWHVMRTTGVAVVASSITTAAGFVGLLFTSHKGVETIGKLALIGIISSLIAVVGLLPGVLSWLGSRRPRNPFTTAQYETVDDDEG